MADRYCDPTLYPAYAAVPTWGTAQDGDGTAMTAATPATASVVFTGVPSSGAIAVLGVTLSPTWATNADVCANNLATAINASSTTATSPAGIARKSQVRNHVYARGPANGAAAGTCEIMTRQGTADVNGQVAVTHTLNNVSSSATVNFAGGVGGAWGYLSSMTGTIWPSSLAAGTYGLWGANLPYVGALTPGDVVHVRSNNVTLAASGGSVTLGVAAQGSAAAPITYLIDDNNKWADGAANNSLTLAINNPNSSGFEFFPVGGAYIYVRAGRLSDGWPALRLKFTGSPGGGASTMYVRYGSPIVMENVEFSLDSIVNNNVIQLRDTGNSDMSRFLNCAVRTGQSQVLSLCTFGNPAKLVFEGGVISNLTATGTQTGTPHVGVFGATSAPDFMQFVGTKFTDFVTGARLCPEGTVARMSFVDCDFGNITVRSPVVYNSAYQTNWLSRYVSITSQVGGRDWSLDTTVGVAEWSSSRSFPTRNGLLFDGVTPWSMRFCSSTQASNVGPMRPFVLPRVAKFNTLPDDDRTVTAHFVLEKGMTWTAADIFLRVHYTDTAGELKTLVSADPFGGALADDSAGSFWSQYGAGGDANNVVWNNAGNIYHKQYKIDVLCPGMAQDTEVAVYLVVARGAGTLSQGGFLDPDFDIV